MARMEKMQVRYVPIGDVVPYDRNPRRNDDAVGPVAASIEEFGWRQPIVVDADGIIIAGHTRYRAALSLGLDEVPVVVASDLTPEQVAAYRLADNRTGELAEWDAGMLAVELDGLPQLDMERFGFTSADMELPAPGDLSGTGCADAARDASDGIEHMSLNDRFGAPPFSVLDARQGYWAEGKRRWLDAGVMSAEGRADELIASCLKTDAYTNGTEYMAPSTSIFDPFLAELMCRWFCPPGGSVLDPFAGGSVRGIVAEATGHPYTGIELRHEQVEANRANARDLGLSPTWICDDALNILDRVGERSADMVLTCPPYADLEVYSDDPRDLSAMGYDAFLDAYREIISRTCRCLRDGRLAVVVIGDVRAPDGTYRGLVSETQRAFSDAGLSLYDDMVYLEPLGTAAVRAPRSMDSMRKVTKVHQSVLVFLKGGQRDLRSFGPVPREERHG